MNDFFARIHWPVMAEKDVEGAWQFLKKQINFASDKFILLLNTINKRGNNRWCTAAVVKSLKKKHKAYRKYLCSRDGLDYTNYVKMRNEATTKVRKAKVNYERSVAKNCKLNPKSFWRYINQKLKKNESISSCQ